MPNRTWSVQWKSVLVTWLPMLSFFYPLSTATGGANQWYSYQSSRKCKRWLFTSPNNTIAALSTIAATTKRSTEFLAQQVSLPLSLISVVRTLSVQTKVYTGTCCTVLACCWQRQEHYLLEKLGWEKSWCKWSPLRSRIFFSWPTFWASGVQTNTTQVRQNPGVTHL